MDLPYPFFRLHGERHGARECPGLPSDPKPSSDVLHLELGQCIRSQMERSRHRGKTQASGGNGTMHKDTQQDASRQESLANFLPRVSFF